MISVARKGLIVALHNKQERCCGDLSANLLSSAVTTVVDPKGNEEQEANQSGKSQLEIATGIRWRQRIQVPVTLSYYVFRLRL